jgi:hypothetical protein
MGGICGTIAAKRRHCHGYHAESRGHGNPGDARGDGSRYSKRDVEQAHYIEEDSLTKCGWEWIVRLHGIRIVDAAGVMRG